MLWSYLVTVLFSVFIFLFLRKKAFIFFQNEKHVWLVEKKKKTFSVIPCYLQKSMEVVVIL